jgi:predicted ATPase/class 3 adenylate cyclase
MPRAVFWTVAVASAGTGVWRTFLFTDIEGSTRLWEAHPGAMSAAVATHDALLRGVMQEHGGQVFKTVGDSFFVTFREPGRAVDAALEAQRRLAAEGWGETGPLRVRMCLHAGEAEERGGDFLGPAVNRTARILALGHGGQVLVSAAVERETAGALPPRARLLDLGSHKLRDLSVSERIHQLLHPELPAAFGPLHSLDTLPNNLALQPTSFVGREEDLLEVSRLLPRAPLVTLVGAGGCGKTRLALQVGAEALGHFRDGVWLVELAPLADPELVVRATADAVGVRPQPGRPLLETLLGHLRSRQLLLLLDNCEHVIEEAARVAHALLARCTELRVLATSREPLRVGGETIWPVAPLACPPDGTAPHDLPAYGATSLFLERARAAAPRAPLRDADAALVARVCRRLDGIPLAIELAAARLRHLPLKELERGLDDRFHLLTGGERTALPRHRTLRAAIDWSHELLAGPERALLRRLAVFVGGWSAEAARELQGGEVDALLEHLADQSLVVTGEGADGRARYGLLESVRAYALEALEAAGEAGEYRRRHALLFASLVTEARRVSEGFDAEAWNDRLEHEMDNVRAALDWLAGTAELRERGLQMATDLWHFCWARGYVPEGRRWLARFLDHAEDAGAATRADAFYASGVLAKESGEYALALEYYERSLELRERLDKEPGRGQANLLFAIAHVVRIRGDYVQARRLYEESLAINRRRGDWGGMGGAYDGLGTVCHLEGNDEASREYHRQALEMFREQGKRVAQVVALGGLGRALIGLKDLRAARRTLREGLRLARRISDRQGVAVLLRLLAGALPPGGCHRRVRVLLDRSLGLAQEIRHLPTIVDALRDHARLALSEGQVERAARLDSAVRRLSQQMGVPVPEPLTPGPPDGDALSLEEAVEYALRG